MHYKVNLMIGIVFNFCSRNKIPSYLYKYHKIADGIKKTRINDSAGASGSPGAMPYDRLAETHQVPLDWLVWFGLIGTTSFAGS